jgi:flagellar protein FlgJ
MSGAIYTDFGHLAGLRGEAQRDPNAALKDVASQFESLFLQQMLKSMRDATLEGGLFDSSQIETYQQMSDKQLSLELARHGGIGLAKAMVEQMRDSGYVSGGSDDGVEGQASDPGANAIEQAQILFKRRIQPAMGADADVSDRRSYSVNPIKESVSYPVQGSDSPQVFPISVADRLKSAERT